VKYCDESIVSKSIVHRQNALDDPEPPEVIKCKVAENRHGHSVTVYARFVSATTGPLEDFVPDV